MQQRLFVMVVEKKEQLLRCSCKLYTTPTGNRVRGHPSPARYSVCSKCDKNSAISATAGLPEGLSKVSRPTDCGRRASAGPGLFASLNCFLRDFSPNPDLKTGGLFWSMRDGQPETAGHAVARPHRKLRDKTLVFLQASGDA